jgi:hypothetical protein
MWSVASMVVNHAEDVVIPIGETARHVHDEIVRDPRSCFRLQAQSTKESDFSPAEAK